MYALIPRLLLPLGLILLLEMLFRAGIWEDMTPENSHAGKTVRVIRGLSNWPDSIDFVTLGDSRAKHGIDHRLIADVAQEYGMTHAKLTIPGAHVLTESLLLRYLESEHPDVQGGIIATSVPALLVGQNGDHELAIAQPLSKVFHRDEILTERFSLNRHSSWGAVSSLYQYREYIQDFVQNPGKRLSELEEEGYSDEAQLFASSSQVPDVCRLDWTNLASCAAYSGDNAHDKHVAGLCARWITNSEIQAGVDSYVQQPLHPALADLIDSWQQHFRSIKWPKPPLVILMPVSHLWYESLAPTGADQWAHRILDPLVEEGVIRLLDYSHFFEHSASPVCEVFTDPYHQSEKGMNELTDDMLPKLREWLYESGGS